MDIPVIYREMRPGEEEQVFFFVSNVFSEFVAQQFSKEGIDEFLRYIHPDELASHVRKNLIVLIAEIGGEIIGVIAIRDFNHVALFSSRPGFSEEGLAKRCSAKPWRFAAAMIHHFRKSQ